MFMLWRKINTCKTFLFFIVDNVSLLFEKNCENETNAERQSNNLEFLDVTTEKLSLSDLMPCSL